MAPLTTRPRGTNDFLPDDTPFWQYVERSLLSTSELYGYSEIRTPMFEHTELFLRGVGDTTDVVSKEMYTFQDKGDRSITLRPEGTAGVCRAAIENGLFGDALPLKLSYIDNCFRYEKSQKGRFRQFHQFGVECYGANDPITDAEVIALAWDCLSGLGLEKLNVEINSIGCPACRARYHEALKDYFSKHMDQLCETCHERFEKNPLRILDCKSPICAEIAKDAPKVIDYLCEDCCNHFEKLKSLLAENDIPFIVNPTIVRGLDYYTRTVFEINVPDFPAICGGGRYGGLAKELGGPDVEGIGFAIGLERLIMVMKEQDCEFPEVETCDIYVGSIGEKASGKSFAIASQLRREGFKVECDLMNRSIKAQMKYANKLNAKYSMILGDDELAQNGAQLKNMATGETVFVHLPSIVEEFYDIVLNGYYASAVDADIVKKP